MSDSQETIRLQMSIDTFDYGLMQGEPVTLSLDGYETLIQGLVEGNPLFIPHRNEEGNMVVSIFGSDVVSNARVVIERLTCESEVDSKDVPQKNEAD